jgi:hypothetical protein
MEVAVKLGQRTALAIGQTLSGNAEGSALGAGDAVAAGFAVAPGSDVR